MNNGFETRELANSILDAVEGELFKCPDLIFAAIIEKENKFYIQLAIREGSGVTIKEDLTIDQIITGRINEFELPMSIPNSVSTQPYPVEVIKTNDLVIPNEQIEKATKRSYFSLLEKVSIKGEILQNNAELLRNKNVFTEKELFVSRNDEKVGKKISITRRGTFGGVFELVGFNGDLFGITNEHIIRPNFSLGNKVQNGKGNQNIGVLFWKCNDIKRDAAIVKLKKDFDIENAPTKINKVAEPIEQESVWHNGANTSYEKSLSTVYSTNATVRIRDRSRNYRIYRNQILINLNTNPGDSGAVVFNSKDEAIGLNFARSNKGGNSKNNFSVANNINNILNVPFNNEQYIFHESKNKKTITLTNKFSLA